MAELIGGGSVTFDVLSLTSHEPITHMVKRTAVNLAATAFFLLLVDGCVYRDPHVEISDDYAISSISHSLPCGLYYKPKSNAEWFATDMSDGNTTEYVLMNLNDDSVLTVHSFDEIFTAVGHDTVDVSRIAPKIEDVTLYTANDRFVAGKGGPDFFLLGLDTHLVTTWKNESLWKQALTTTGLSTRHLSNPKAWHRQCAPSRDLSNLRRTAGDRGRIDDTEAQPPHNSVTEQTDPREPPTRIEFTESLHGRVIRNVLPLKHARHGCAVDCNA